MTETSPSVCPFGISLFCLAPSGVDLYFSLCHASLFLSRKAIPYRIRPGAGAQIYTWTVALDVGNTMVFGPLSVPGCYRIAPVALSTICTTTAHYISALHRIPPINHCPFSLRITRCSFFAIAFSRAPWNNNTLRDWKRHVPEAGAGRSRAPMSPSSASGRVRASSATRRRGWHSTASTSPTQCSTMAALATLPARATMPQAAGTAAGRGGGGRAMPYRPTHALALHA
ncbi:unnamed protein product [Phaeothamnion confervicola]